MKNYIPILLTDKGEDILLEEANKTNTINNEELIFKDNSVEFLGAGGGENSELQTVLY